MSRSQRDKGLKGEREVARLYEQRGFEVRGLEASGDHVCIAGPASGILVHSEVKRQETARPWLWLEQAWREAEPGSVAIVHFRRNRSPWVAMLAADTLADLLENHEATCRALAQALERVDELERLNPAGRE